jgi:hypothetical protein
MNNHDKNKCYMCAGDIESIGFNGDWEQFQCVDCESILERPVSYPSDGYTMEDLDVLSDVDW